MDETDGHDLVWRLFAILTGMFEDGAALAADGQNSSHPENAQAEIAGRLHAAGETIATLSGAIIALTSIA